MSVQIEVILDTHKNNNNKTKTKHTPKTPTTTTTTAYPFFTRAIQNLIRSVKHFTGSLQISLGKQNGEQ